MKETIKITESDLTRIVKQVINETENRRMYRLGAIGIHAAIVVTIILNVDSIDITDKYGDDVNASVGDTYICNVTNVIEDRRYRRSTGYLITAEDDKGNIITFNYDNPNFDEGDKIKIKIGRPLRNLFSKSADEVNTYKP
jgi:hypothetical protein